ncbi:hypothetical protein V8E53_015664 [Lactarius tabidus]
MCKVATTKAHLGSHPAGAESGQAMSGYGSDSNVRKRNVRAEQMNSGDVSHKSEFTWEHERTGSSHAPLARPHLLSLIDDELPDREWDELGTDKVNKRGSCGGIDVGGCRTEGGDAQAIDSGGKRPGTARKGGRREGVGRGLPPVKSNGEGKERSGEVSGLSKGTLLLRELRPEHEVFEGGSPTMTVPPSSAQQHLASSVPLMDRSCTWRGRRTLASDDGVVKLSMAAEMNKGCVRAVES